MMDIQKSIRHDDYNYAAKIVKIIETRSVLNSF